MFFKKYDDDFWFNRAVQEKLDDFARAMGFEWLGSTKHMLGHIKESLMPYDTVTVAHLAEHQAHIKRVEQKLDMLIDYLGLETKTGPYIGKKVTKKGAKK